MNTNHQNDVLLREFEEDTTPRPPLNWKKMVEDIAPLVESDFAQDMDLKNFPNAPKFTQEEAEQMANIIGRVYLISHSLHCRACDVDYRLDEALSPPSGGMK